MIQDIIDIVIKHRVSFLSGLSVTAQICLIVWVLGIFIGIILGYVGNKVKFVNRITRNLSFVISGIPVLVFLFWLHYPAQSFLNVEVSPFTTTVLMLTILNSLAVSEIVKNGINNVPKQFLEAATACGMNNLQTFQHVQFPLIIRHILPAMILTQVNMLHLSLFGSLISVEEIFRMSQRVISIEYKPVEIYTALGLFFLAITLPLNGVAKYLKHRYQSKS